MKNKYNNKKYYEDGEKFDSALERDVYLALIEKRKNGLISGLEFQKKFLLQDKFECDGVKYRKIDLKEDKKIETRFVYRLCLYFFSC